MTHRRTVATGTLSGVPTFPVRKRTEAVASTLSSLLSTPGTSPACAVFGIVKSCSIEDDLQKENYARGKTK